MDAIHKFESKQLKVSSQLLKILFFCDHRDNDYVADREPNVT